MDVARKLASGLQVIGTTARNGVPVAGGLAVTAELTTARSRDPGRVVRADRGGVRCAGQAILPRMTDLSSESVQDRRQGLRERLRAEWIAGAEEEWRRRTGRPVAAAELERVLPRYPGDVKVIRLIQGGAVRVG